MLCTVNCVSCEVSWCYKCVWCIKKYIFESRTVSFLVFYWTIKPGFWNSLSDLYFYVICLSASYVHMMIVHDQKCLTLKCFLSSMKFSCPRIKCVGYIYWNCIITKIFFLSSSTTADYLEKIYLSETFSLPCNITWYCLIVNTL